MGVGDSRSNDPKPVLSRINRFLSVVFLGYDPVFAEEMTRTMGFRNANKWGRLLMSSLENLETRYGEFTAQVLVATSAMWNGCQFCSVGHMLAGNMTYFLETGELFPIDEQKIGELQLLDDDDLIAEIDRLLADAKFDEVRGLIHRLYDLKFGVAKPETKDDELLMAVIATWDVINECSIMTELSPDKVGPLSRMGRRPGLRTRYRAARKALDAQTPEPDPKPSES